MMKLYVILLRGINVGGKNKIAMAELKLFLEEQGFKNVVTYIQSGNVVLSSDLGAKKLSAKIEDCLPKKFKLDSSLIKIVALPHKTFKNVVAQAPKGFGEDNSNYRYFVLFLMGTRAGNAMKEIDVREGIDKAWQGETVIYYRLPSLTSPHATKSYLNKVAQKPIYAAITMRNWKTTTKLLEILEGIKPDRDAITRG
jgi:uncharacterized protein (DUF1697 family)